MSKAEHSLNSLLFDTSRVLELTSKMTEGAEHLREITSSVRMVS